MLRLLVATFLLTYSIAVFTDETSKENLFQKGLAAYQNKQFTEARDLFQKLIEQDAVSAPLLHNLALAEFQLQQAPLALALWRKALTLDPGFAPARAGRDFAEGKLQVRGFERDRLRENLRRTLEFVSFYESLWVVALFFAFAGWLWIRYYADRRHALDQEQPLPPFPTAAVLLSVILTVCVALSALKLRQTLSMRATVTAAKTGARSLPAEEGVRLFELNGGAEVLVRRQNGDWLQVQNAEGSSGWLRKDEVFITSGRAP